MIESFLVINPMNEKQTIVLDNFVVLEGLDGSGTTTQASLLAGKLARVPHFCTSEPTNNPIGSLIRSILKRDIDMDPRSTALLFAADRNEHLSSPEVGILAQLRQGKLVISDRYLFSSLAYQSRECGFEYVFSLNRNFPLPRVLIFLNTPVHLSQKRLKHRSGENRELFDEADIQSDILANYYRGFEQFSGTGMQVHQLDGSLPAETLCDKCWEIISKRFR